jgi:hypothetical protein
MTGLQTMANDVRPFRSAAYVLLLVATGIFAAGIWTEMRQAATDPATRMMADVVAPLVGDQLPGFLGSSDTVFGTFAKIGGVVALAGLLLLTLRRGTAPAAAPAAAPAPMPIVPRRPSAIRAARAGTTAAAAAQPDPQTAAPAAMPGSVPDRSRPARRFQRASLMLIGTATIGLSGVLVYSRLDALPVPAFVPPQAISGGLDTLLLLQVAAALAVVLSAFVFLRVMRRRRTPA